MINENNLTAKLKVGNMNNLPYDDSFFDEVIFFWRLLIFQERKDEKSINELYRILKKDGKALILIKTKDDFRNKMGKN